MKGGQVIRTHSRGIKAPVYIRRSFMRNSCGISPWLKRENTGYYEGHVFYVPFLLSDCFI